MQRQTSLAKRAKLVIEYSIELRAELERERTRFRAERDRARQVSSAIRVLNKDPIARLFALWHAIDLSDRCGSLQERTSILLLAEAFFKAKGDFWNIVTRRDEPATGPYPTPANTRTTLRLVSLK